MFDKESAIKEVDKLYRDGGVYPAAVIQSAITRIEELENQIKPIRCKDRMPKKEEYPVLMWDNLYERWDAAFSERHLLGIGAEFWVKAPPKPE